MTECLMTMKPLGTGLSIVSHLAQLRHLCSDTAMVLPKGAAEGIVGPAIVALEEGGWEKNVRALFWLRGLYAKLMGGIYVLYWFEKLSERDWLSFAIASIEGTQ